MNSIALATVHPSSQAFTLPKIGTLIPNRIFVGGISSNTTEDELRAFFSAFGSIKDVKVIYDKSGLSKGSYGFVTFENQQTAEALIKNESETLMLNDRKLNIGYAVRKQHILPKNDINGTVLLAHNACALPNGVSVLQLCPHDHSIVTMNQPALLYPATVMVSHAAGSREVCTVLPTAANVNPCGLHQISDTPEPTTNNGITYTNLSNGMPGSLNSIRALNRTCWNSTSMSCPIKREAPTNMELNSQTNSLFQSVDVESRARLQNCNDEFKGPMNSFFSETMPKVIAQQQISWSQDRFNENLAAFAKNSTNAQTQAYPSATFNRMRELERSNTSQFVQSDTKFDQFIWSDAAVPRKYPTRDENPFSDQFKYDLDNPDSIVDNFSPCHSNCDFFSEPKNDQMETAGSTFCSSLASRSVFNPNPFHIRSPAPSPISRETLPPFRDFASQRFFTNNNDTSSFQRVRRVDENTGSAVCELLFGPPESGKLAHSDKTSSETNACGDSTKHNHT